jgi:uncharacterized membrane protein
VVIAANPLRRRTNDSVNVFLVKVWHRTRFRRSTDLFDDALLPDSDPEDLEIYLLGLFIAWGMLLAVLGVILAGVGWLLNKTAGNQGADIAFVTFVFVAAFCFTGVADAAWRHEVANQACRRARRTQTIDEGTQRLMRLARINDATLVLQFVVGVVAATVALAFL